MDRLHEQPLPVLDVLTCSHCTQLILLRSQNPITCSPQSSVGNRAAGGKTVAFFTRPSAMLEGLIRRQIHGSLPPGTSQAWGLLCVLDAASWALGAGDTDDPRRSGFSLYLFQDFFPTICPVKIRGHTDILR